MEWLSGCVQDARKTPQETAQYVFAMLLGIFNIFFVFFVGEHLSNIKFTDWIMMQQWWRLKWCTVEAYQVTIYQWCSQGQNLKAKAKASTLKAKAKAWTFEAKAKAKAWTFEAKAKA